MKIRIVSNGTPEGTKVFDDHGRQLPLAILRIKWECSVNKPAIAELVVADVEVQVTGEVAALGKYDKALALTEEQRQADEAMSRANAPRPTPWKWNPKGQ